jgi:tRNA (guanine-N7-)-methyltransferase
MSRSLKYEIPGVDPRVPISDVAEKGWPALFGGSGRGRDAQESTAAEPARVLEIGFGRGEFLLEMARRSPGVEFLGLEISYKRTLKMARKVARAGFENVRLIEGLAEQAIQQLFDPGSLDEIWINFSDPWPKRRHAHRRLIQPGFLGDAAVALRPEGTLYVATDDVPYAHQMNEAFSGSSRLENVYAPWPFLSEVRDRIRTGYEEQWRAAGRPMHFFAYRPRNRASAPSDTGASR